jgi:hypothetical protein
MPKISQRPTKIVCAIHNVYKKFDLTKFLLLFVEKIENKENRAVFFESYVCLIRIIPQIVDAFNYYYYFYDSERKEMTEVVWTKISPSLHPWSPLFDGEGENEKLQ